jgi:competence ComEA-like helix-hairpin-helix protein
MPSQNNPLDRPPRYGWRFGQQHQLAVFWIAAAAIVSVAFASARLSIKSNSVRPAQSAFIVDINSASAGELVAIPSVGPSLATAIVDHRKEHGPFESLQSLTEVPGIGEMTLDRLHPYLRPIP